MIFRELVEGDVHFEDVLAGIAAGLPCPEPGC